MSTDAGLFPRCLQYQKNRCLRYKLCLLSKDNWFSLLAHHVARVGKSGSCGGGPSLGLAALQLHPAYDQVAACECRVRDSVIWSCPIATVLVIHLEHSLRLLGPCEFCYEQPRPVQPPIYFRASHLCPSVACIKCWRIHSTKHRQSCTSWTLCIRGSQERDSGQHVGLRAEFLAGWTYAAAS